MSVVCSAAALATTAVKRDRMRRITSRDYRNMLVWSTVRVERRVISPAAARAGGGASDELERGAPVDYC